MNGRHILCHLVNATQLGWIIHGATGPAFDGNVFAVTTTDPDLSRFNFLVPTLNGLFDIDGTGREEFNLLSDQTLVRR